VQATGFSLLEIEDSPERYRAVGQR